MARGKHAARAAVRRDHDTEAQIADLKDQIATLNHQQKVDAARHADELRDLHAEISQRAKTRADELFEQARSQLTEELRTEVHDQLVEKHARAVHQYARDVNPASKGPSPRLAQLFEEIGAGNMIGDLFFATSERAVRRKVNSMSAKKMQNEIVNQLKEDGAPRAS